jgi:hypothetical protein
LVSTTTHLVNERKLLHCVQDLFHEFLALGRERGSLGLEDGTDGCEDGSGRDEARVERGEGVVRRAEGEQSLGMLSEDGKVKRWKKLKYLEVMLRRTRMYIYGKLRAHL